MRNLKPKYSLFLLILAISCTQLVAKHDPRETRATVEEIGTHIARAMIRGDTETLLSYYTEDVISMPNYGPMIKGKDALKRQDEEMREAGLVIHSLNYTTLETWICENWVFEVGEYGISLTLPGMTHPVADNGKYLNIWEMGSDGSLLIKMEIWNTDVNPLAPDKPEM